ncbi:sodium channel protein Nach isoform X2 [Cardiocondyla obscurior]|uniref:sodium channel protein Nach isoform X2 n=1 Tax=Cardiocondyla obscurior TaxID=286306 RepID=UPI00396570D3
MKSDRTQSRQRVSNVNAKCWSILKRQAAEFCQNTGLHGYKYISQSERSMTERIIWAIIVFVSLGCAIVLMKMAWLYFATHPTLTVIETTHHGIWNFPFPAITICDINRMSYNLTKQFVENLETPANVSKNYLIQEMRLMNELLLPGIFGYDVQKNLTYLQDIIDNNHLSIPNVMNLITQNCSTLLTMCKWKGKTDQCDKYFKQSLSRNGLCCSFNYYTFPNSPALDNVERSAACGYESGMSIVINVDPNNYHAPTIGAYGIKVMIHYALDYPDFDTEIELVRLNTTHFISLNPTETYAKREMKDMPVSTRKCILNDETDKILYANVKERNLTYSAYSYHNCLAECRATIIRAKCGCIPYFVPQNSTRICNLKDVQCLTKYKSLFDTSWPSMDETVISLLKTINNINESPCGCIPDCTLYYYPFESSYGNIDTTTYYYNGRFSKNSRNGTAISMHNHTLVHIYFNDLVAFQYRRIIRWSAWFIRWLQSHVCFRTSIFFRNTRDN